jgi:hypothetical protein
MLGHFCALPNLQSLPLNMLQIGPRPLELTYNQPRGPGANKGLSFCTPTIDAHVDRADDFLPKESRG